MPLPDFDRAAQYAHTRLSRELSPLLTYHSLAHTCDDVVPAAERLAIQLGLQAEPTLLVRTAAWYHDLGFVVQRHEHEAVGVEIARAALPAFGYTAEQVAQIAGMIMATRVPQTPHTLHEQIVADADLDVLGREDFWLRNVALRSELAAYGQTLGDAAWYNVQISFLHKHRYWTSAARALRDVQKQQHLEQLLALLQAVNDEA